MNSNGEPAAVMKDLGGLYLFSYERYMSFLDLLENPEAIREQIMLEVAEQWDAIIQAMDERLERRMAAKAAAVPVNQQINPEVGK